MASSRFFSEQDQHPTAKLLGNILNKFPNITNWIIAKNDGLFLASKEETKSYMIKEEAAQIATLNNIAAQIIQLHAMEEPFLAMFSVNLNDNSDKSQTTTSEVVSLLISLWDEYTLFFTISAPYLLEQEVDLINEITIEILKKFITEFPMATAHPEQKIDLIKAIPFIIKNIRNDPNIFSVAIERTRLLADSEEPMVRECLAKYLKEYLEAGIPADVIVEAAKKLDVDVPEF